MDPLSAFATGILVGASLCILFSVFFGDHHES